MRRLFTSIALVSFAIASFAGGLLTNTNQSASFVRNPARFASLETDAIYFNPAGTAFFKEGWAFSVNWQMIWQDRDVVNSGKTYKGEVYVPCMPTLFAAYKTGDWTFSGFFGMPGGGGNAKFDNGLPMFNQMGAGLAQTINPALSAASKFESTQYLFSLQLGAAYKINDNLSAYAGIRGNYTSLSYEGSINAIHPANGSNVANILALDLTQTGIAFAPILGIDYKVGNFNFAAKYEFRAINNIENDTKDFSSEALGNMLGTTNLNGVLGNLAAHPLFGPVASKLVSLEDGQKFRYDAPATLTLAASWDIIDRVKVMAGYNYYFDKDAKIESLIGKANTMQALTRNTYEILGGVEVKVTDKLLLSAGVQFSDFGVNERYLSDVSFIDDSFMTGVGAKYSFNENWDLNAGFCYANYAHGVSGASKYLRKTYNASVGVDFRF